MTSQNECLPISLLAFRSAILFIAGLAERGSKIFAIVIVCGVGVWPAVTFGQDIKNPQSAVDNLMRSNLHVDPTTGALQLQVPLGEYRGRGEASLPVTLNYSSKLWNIKYSSTNLCGVSAYVA